MRLGTAIFWPWSASPVTSVVTSVMRYHPDESTCRALPFCPLQQRLADKIAHAALHPVLLQLGEIDLVDARILIRILDQRATLLGAEIHAELDLALLVGEGIAAAAISGRHIAGRHGAGGEMLVPDHVGR